MSRAGIVVAAFAMLVVLAVPSVAAGGSAPATDAVNDPSGIHVAPGGTAAGSASPVSSAGVNAPGGGWTQLPVPSGPSARVNASLVYDPSASADILFGGTAGGALNDTWAYTAAGWTQLLPLSAPSARSGAAAAFDPVSGTIVLFGGTTGSSYLGDTWQFAGGTWILLHPAVSPSPRTGAGLAFDPKLGCLVLFGGADPTLLNDTWTWCGSTWAPYASSGAPSPRVGAALGEDPEIGGVVLFGGNDGALVGDTWFLGGLSWQRISTGVSSPSPRVGASATYDPVDGYLILTGGWSSTNTSSTWAFRERHWVELAPPGAAPRAGGEAATFDEITGVGLLFGGEFDGTLLGGTWAYRASASPTSAGWATLKTNASPADRTQAGLAYDPAEGYVVLFGGQNHFPTNKSPAYFSDTWTYRDAKWTQLNLSVHPSGRRGAMMEWDPALGALLLFGGSTTNGFFNDTWEFKGGQWISIATPVAPAPRRSGSMAYDPAISAMVLYGGHNGSGGGLSGWFGVFGDTWVFNATGWHLVTGGGNPGPRSEALLTYDPTEGQLVMFGGYQQNKSHPWEDEVNSTWVYGASGWVNITSVIGGPAPLHRDGAGFVYDPATGYTLLFGGDDNKATKPPTIWTFAYDHWTKICSCVAPTWSANHATYDATDGYLFTTSQVPGNAHITTLVWATNASLTAAASPNPVSAGRSTLLSAWGGWDLAPSSFSWTVNGTASGKGLSHPVTFASPGTYPVTVSARVEGVGTVVAHLNVTVGPAFVATLSVAPTRIPLGGTFYGNGSITGGVGTVTWSFSPFPTGCATPTGLSSFHCRPTAVGTYHLLLRATDQVGEVALARATVTVT